MFDSIKKKINIRSLMGQSEALEENTVQLKKGITTLVGLFGERESLKDYSPIQRSKRKLPVQAGETEEKKKKKDKTPSLLDVLGNLLGPIMGLISTLASLLGPLLGPTLGLGAVAAAFLLRPKTTTKYLLRNILKNILRFGDSIVKFVFKIFDTVLRAFRNAFDSVGKFIRKIFGAIGDGVRAVKNFISDKILKPIRGAIDDLLNSKFFQNIKNIFDDMVQSVKNFIDRGFKAIRGVIDDIFVMFKSFVGDLVDQFLKYAKGFADNLIDLGRRIGNVVITPLRETVQTLQKEASETIIKRLKKSFMGTVNYVVDGIVEKIGGVKNTILNLLNNVPEKIGFIPTGIKSVKERITNVFDGVVNFIKEPQKTLTKFIEIAGKRGSEVVNIFQEGTSEALNQLSNARQSFTKTLTDAYSGMQKFGSNISSFAGKVADRVKGGLDYVGQLGDRFKNALGVFIASAQEKVVKPVADTVGQVARPLINAAKDPETYKKFFSGVSDTVGPLVDNVLTPIRNAQAGFLKLIQKLPGGRAFVKGFKASTGRIDRLFALADIVVTYGQKIRNKDNEQVEASILGEGQSIGTTLLRVMGGFGGSAILGGAGTAVPIPGLGIAGSILGGVLGEEAGMLVAGNLSETEQYSQIMDPFIGGQVFEKPKPEDSIMSLFSSSPEPEKPVGEGGGYGIMPTRRQRSMTDMEEYPEYDTETNIIIMKQRAAQSQQVIASHGGGGGGVSIKSSSDTSLNTFKTITMSQLAYV